MPPRKLYRGDLRKKHKPEHSKALRTAQHMLADGNRADPQPYVPATLARPYNREATRRLKRMVARELRDMEE